MMVHPQIQPAFDQISSGRSTLVGLLTTVITTANRKYLPEWNSHMNIFGGLRQDMKSR